MHAADDATVGDVAGTTGQPTNRCRRSARDTLLSAWMTGVVALVMGPIAFYTAVVTGLQSLTDDGASALWVCLTVASTGLFTVLAISRCVITVLASRRGFRPALIGPWFLAVADVLMLTVMAYLLWPR